MNVEACLSIVADGDILYAVSTAGIADGLDPVTLAVVASEVAWDAVLASVPPSR